MKYTIHIRWLLSLFAIVWASSSFAQGIRKNYLEMTSSEKASYVNSVNTLYANGVMGDVALDHSDNGVPIHRNITFLPWHRELLRKFERELQQLDPYLAIPYWDWRTDRVREVPEFWANDFLNLNNLNSSADPNGVSLTRNLGPSNSPALPTTTDINNVLSVSDFQTFAGGPGDLNAPDMGVLEAEHNTPHGWVGGTMGTFLSPFDPVFYLHHSMVDKVWADWEEIPGHTSFFPAGTSPSSTALAGFPGINSNDLIDTKALGIFYTENQLAELEGYTVSNDNLSSEKFAYQYRIEAKDNFLVPSGKDAEFRSCTVIELLPGFKADNGALFEARIDGDCDFSTSALVAQNTGNGAFDGFDSSFEQKNGSTIDLQGITVKNFPNPFGAQTTIMYDLPADAEVTLSVSDANGKQIARLLDGKFVNKGTHQVIFDGSNYPAGMYYYTIQVGDHAKTNKMMLVK